MNIIQKIFDAIDSMSETFSSLNKSSSDGDVVKLTISSNVASPSSQVCKSCLILAPSSNAGAITVRNSGSAATANSFPLVQDVYVPIPVENLNLLRFYGASDDDVVYIMWRN